MLPLAEPNPACSARFICEARSTDVPHGLHKKTKKQPVTGMANSLIVLAPSPSPMPAADPQGDFGILHMISQILNENAAQDKDREVVKPVMDTSIESKQTCSDHDIIDNAERPVIQCRENERNGQILVRNGGRKDEKDSGIETKTLQDVLFPQENACKKDAR